MNCYTVGIATIIALLYASVGTEYIRMLDGAKVSLWATA